MYSVVLMVDGYSLTELCNLEYEIIQTKHLTIPSNSEPDECSGISGSIIDTYTSNGPFLGICLNSGIVKINAPKNKYDLHAAFSVQTGGSIQFNDIKGKIISKFKSGGILQGKTVRGDYFCNDMSGGSIKVNSVYGDGSFNNMDGGIVIVKDLYGMHPFENMNSGIVIVREFHEQKRNRVGGVHKGGTIITTDGSFNSFDRSFNYNLLNDTVVFTGPNASKQLTNFSNYLLKRSPEWLAEMYNQIILGCNLKNPEKFSEFHDEDTFMDSLNWMVPIELENNHSDKDLIKELLRKFSDLYENKDLPAFYKHLVNNPIQGNKPIDSTMRRLYGYARGLKRNSDKFLYETGYRGKLEVNDMELEDIFDVLFSKDGTVQTNLL